MKYTGVVTITSYVGNAKVVQTQHNEGTDELFRILAKAMAGGDVSNEKPIQIDLLMLVDGQYHSILNSPIYITGLTYTNSGTIESPKWVTRSTARISFSDYVIVPTNEQLRLTLNSTNKELAYIDVEDNTPFRISSGMQTLVEWTLNVANE